MIELSQEEAQRIRRPASRKDLVLELIRAAIVDGRLKAGTKLDQNEIANTMGVSRMPVREALKQLETEGLVVVYPYKGVEVAKLDPKDIREMFAIRGGLERLAVAKAIGKLDANSLRRMKDILRRMDRMTGNEADLEEWTDLNRTFHATINAACDWSRLLEMIESLRGNVERYVRLYISVRGQEQSQKEHWALFEAIEAGDVERAQDIIEAHSRNTAEFLVKAIETAGKNDVHDQRNPDHRE